MLFLENTSDRQISIVLRTRNFKGALTGDEQILDVYRDGGREKRRFALANAPYTKGRKPHRADRLDLESGATHIIGDDSELADEIADILAQREALEALGVVISES